MGGEPPPTALVDVAASPPRVDTARRRTAGHRLRRPRARTRITAAHRGQNRLRSAAADAGNRPGRRVGVRRRRAGRCAGRHPPTVLGAVHDSPRALAVSGDGSVVYAAALQSGNQTMTISEGAVCDGGQEASCEVDGVAMPGGLPAPNVNVDGVPHPRWTDRSPIPPPAPGTTRSAATGATPCGCPYPTPTSSRSTPWRHRRHRGVRPRGTVIYGRESTNGALFATNRRRATRCGSRVVRRQQRARTPARAG